MTLPHSKLIGLKRKAEKEGWSKFIRTPVDEAALLRGYTFSVERWDHFRFFCENFLQFSKGKWQGQPFEFLPYQELLCGSVFGWINADTGLRRFRRGYTEMGKKNGKALALDTLVPTPNGFRRIEDVHVGDLVFGDDGKPTKVIAESEIFTDHDCFKLTFQNGEEVVADADHLWEVQSILPQKIINTRELFDAKKLTEIEIRTFVGKLKLNSIKPCRTIPTKCIAVDNDSHLFLITKSYLVTHNTTLSAAIALYMLAGDNEAGAEVYNVANDRDQAGLLWNAAADYVESNDFLRKLIKVTRSTKRMNMNNGESTFTAWSSDMTSKDGPNIHCAIIDELHEWKGPSAREFWRKIRYGSVARAQPLCPFVITTAGDDRFSLCYEQHTYAKKVLDGFVEDFGFWAMIYGADAQKIKDDPEYWRSEEAAQAANPAYEIILKKEDFEADIVEVEGDPASKMAFFRYRLGVWTEKANPWIDKYLWDKNVGETPFTEEDLAGQVCFGGMDLSSVNDFTSVVYVFPYFDADGIKKYRILPRFFCPEDTFAARIRKAEVSLQVWLDDGLIRLTPGSAIDHEAIFEAIEADCSKFVVRQLGYDRYSAAWIIQQIQKKIPEVELFPISQQITSMSEPTKALYTTLSQGRIEHLGNPVLTWQVGNAVPETNSNGDIKLSKPRSADKIDGVVSLVMGFNQAQLGEMEVKKKVSVYSSANFSEMMKKLEGA